jgi:hypothetical protein
MYALAEILSIFLAKLKNGQMYVDGKILLVCNDHVANIVCMGCRLDMAFAEFVGMLVLY